MICLPIVTIKNKKLFLCFQIFLIISIIGFFIGAIIGGKLDKFNNIYTQVTGIVFLVSIIAWIVLRTAVKRYKIVGKISLNDEIIVVEFDNGNTQQYLLKEVKNIKFRIGGYDGEQIDLSAISSDGIDNFIEFYINGSKITFEFFLKDITVLRVFMRRIKEFKENQIQINLADNNEY